MAVLKQNEHYLCYSFIVRSCCKKVSLFEMIPRQHIEYTHNDPKLILNICAQDSPHIDLYKNNSLVHIAGVI